MDQGQNAFTPADGDVAARPSVCCLHNLSNDPPPQMVAPVHRELSKVIYLSHLF